MSGNTGDVAARRFNLSVCPKNLALLPDLGQVSNIVGGMDVGEMRIGLNLSALHLPSLFVKQFKELDLK